MKKSESSQKTIKIDQNLWDELDIWLDSDEAKRLGYHSKAQFATEAIREHLQKAKYEPLLKSLSPFYSEEKGFDPELINALKQLPTKNKKLQSLSKSLKKI